MGNVKSGRRRSAKISSKHQITIPIDAMRQAGLEAGDRVTARSDGAGRVVIERDRDIVADLAGSLTGVFEPGELDDLRGEWD